MKLLLDTHVWLWALQDHKRLNKKARTLLESANNELWLSPISVWEAALLIENGRIRIKTTFQRWLDDAFAAMQVIEAGFNANVAVISRQVAVKHEDPADRFIAATAQIFDLTLLTADAHLLDGRGFKTIDCG
jgi:PIN domain nuclease of toxin-antitoxin system